MASEHQLFHLDHRSAFHTRAITVFRDTLSKGFSHFVSSITAPVASGWSGCRALESVAFSGARQERSSTNSVPNRRHSNRRFRLSNFAQTLPDARA
jgi:hypothetical protein